MTREKPKHFFGANPSTALQKQRDKQREEITQLEAALAAERQEQERLQHQIDWIKEQLVHERELLDELGRFQVGSDAQALHLNNEQNVTLHATFPKH